MAGGKIDILIEPDLKGFSSKLESGLKGPLGTLGKVGAAVGAAMGGAAAVKDVVQVGIEMDKAANNLQAVTQATNAEMAVMKEHAKDLGKAADLTATSTTDAMTAMLELSKGGFTIQESMDAAKGSLRLASAAQIEVGQAAGMTTQMIQAFGLQAEDAARVSDVLAGAANAAAGEIPDMAMGMTQAGTVANMFGVTMEETVTALSMFANKGVQGSDAGTMLKTMLTQLANPSKQAAQAMDELGLSAFDAQGNFVGLPGLFDQLREARSRLSQEDFNQKAGAVFGTDAIRAAAIAAESGVDEWDNLYNAITRTGQAAEMAEAQTNGLPGVAERLENTTTALKEEVYEQFQPLLVDLGNAAIDSLENVQPKIEGLARGAASFAGGVKDVFGTIKVIAGDVTGALGTVGQAAKPVVDLLGKLSKSDGEGSFLTSPAAAMGLGLLVTKFTDLVPAADRSAGKMRAFNDAVRLQRTLASQAGEKVGVMAAAWGEVERRSPTWKNASDQFRRGSSHMQMWAVQAKTAAGNTTGLAKAMGNSAGALATFGNGVASVGRGSMSLLNSGVKGLIGALGGPWGVAIMGATTLLGHFYQKHLEAEQAAAAAKGRISDLAGTYDELTGSITKATDAMILQQLEEAGAMTGARRAGVGDNAILNAVKNGQDSQAWLDVRAKNMAAAEKAVRSNEELRVMFEKANVDIGEYIEAWGTGNSEAMQKLQKQVEKSDLWGNRNFADIADETLADFATFQNEVVKTTGETAEAAKQAAADAMSGMQERVQNTTKLFDIIGDRASELNGKKMSIDITGDAPEQVEKMIDDLAELGIKASKIDGKLVFDYTEATDAYTLLEKLGLAVSKDHHGRVVIEAGSLEEAQAKADALGIKVRELEDGTIVMDLDDEATRQRLIELKLASEIDGTFTLADNIDEVTARNNALNGADTSSKHTVSDNTADTRNNIDSNNGRNTSSTHTITVRAVEAFDRSAYGMLTVAGPKMNANGSFRTAANGHLSKQEAMMAAGGNWIVWAEDETEGESFIPHAMSKRARSTEILRQTAQLFGLDLVDKAGKPVGSRGISTAAAAPVRFYANGGLNSFTEGRKFTAGNQSYLVSDLIEVTQDHIQAVGTIAAAEKDLADLREQFAREVDDVAKAEERLEDARKQQGERGKGITEAEKDLVKARKNLAKAEKELAEKSKDGKAKEDELEAARDRVADAADGVTKAEERVTKAHEDSEDAGKAVTEAEQELAKAREVVASQTDRAAKAQRQYVAGYITAAGEAVQRVLEVGADIAGLVSDKFAAVSDFFGAMGEVAESVAQLKQTVVELNMEQVRLRMNQMTAAADVQSAEIAVARTRAEGIGSVADAEAELERIQRRKYAAEFDSIEAMFAAQTRYYDTGVFSWQTIQDAMQAATAEERAAIANVALAKANAALNDLNAVRDAELAAYDYQTAVLNNQAAVSELSIYTDALREQSELLAGMSVNQANAAAAAMDGKAQQAQGHATRMAGAGKTIGAGAAGAAAGFALGGPLGALVGGISGLLVGGLGSAKDFRQGTADIKVGKHKVETNKAEMDAYLDSLTPAERKKFMQDAGYVGGANIRTTLEAMQRKTDDKLQAHANATESIKLQREQQRLAMEQQRRSEAAVLQSEVDYYTAQKKIAESETEKQVAAYAEMARIAAETRDNAIAMQADLNAGNTALLGEIRQLVGYAEQEAAQRGVKTHNVEFTMPPGNAFTREQTIAMIEQIAASADIRLTELENKNAPTGADYFVR